jgi:hyperosmotically inducible periplasmic protein
MEITRVNKTPGLLILGTVAALTGLVGCNKAAEPSSVAVPPTSVAAAKVNDVDVSANVKKALQGNDMLKSFDISVSTINGDVRLSGMLDSQAQIDEALRTARAANGVMTLKDDLTIKK